MGEEPSEDHSILEKMKGEPKIREGRANSSLRNSAVNGWEGKRQNQGIGKRKEEER